MVSFFHRLFWQHPHDQSSVIMQLLPPLLLPTCVITMDSAVRPGNPTFVAWWAKRNLQGSSSQQSTQQQAEAQPQKDIQDTRTDLVPHGQKATSPPANSPLPSSSCAARAMESPWKRLPTPPHHPSPPPQLYGFCADKKAPSAKEFRKLTPTQVSAVQLNRDAGWGRVGQSPGRVAPAWGSHLGSFPFSFIQLESLRLLCC